MGGGCLVLGGGLLRWGAWSRGVPGPGGAWWRPPLTATAAGGTHPTGMHLLFVLSMTAILLIFNNMT